MAEKGGPVRRSRRAASLTAQVLWSLQLEDDSNLAVRSNKKPAVATEENLAPVSSKPKTERKRKVPEASIIPVVNTAEKQTNEKKRKLSPACSEHAFPVRQPFLVSKDSKPKKKLTASVAPLIKPRPVPVTSSRTTAPATVSSGPHSNPILLLPVSLHPNQNAQNGAGQKVGGLQLVTVQAPPGLLNCLNLNKTIVNTAAPAQTKLWSAGTSKYMTTLSRPIQPALKTPVGPSVSVRTSSQNIWTANKTHIINENVKVQLEPLNLKVGETTVPHSSKNLQRKQCVARIQPIRPVEAGLPKTAPKNKALVVSQSAQKPPSNASTTSSKNKKNLPKSQLPLNPTKMQRGSKLILATTVKGRPTTSSYTSVERKYRLKCPSPDYACSSPDVDDVVRTPRHTCNKRHINLRNKAAPAPGTRDYELFVEQQRRLLSAIKRKQKNKARARARSEAKKVKVKRKSSEEDDDDRPLTSAEPFKLLSSSESKHGWKWLGKPYTCMVYSVAHGKYVSRTCYPAMMRKDDDDGTIDVILVRDCVFLLAGEEDELSYVAKVCALWESPTNKEMTMSVVWYYRPEHVGDVKKRATCEDEIFSSKHQDNVSVACVEQRCKVLTYSKFCRLHSRLKNDGMWKSSDLRRAVPPSRKLYVRPLFSFEQALDPQDMFFCRHLYDVHSNRVRYKLPLPVSLSHDHAKRSGMASSSVPKQVAS